MKIIDYYTHRKARTKLRGLFSAIYRRQARENIA